MAPSIRKLVGKAIGKAKQTKQVLTPDSLTKFVDSRFGFTNTMLKPAPSYSLNPFYWLGALAIMAFGIQVLTGFLMLLYYIPTPAQAYASTILIMQTVPFGELIETVHLYGAYAMILLTFLHLMRGYFASAQKKPRELMWVTGMVMGIVTLMMGLTGYLLPWTVVSKSATDVSISMIGLLPPQLAGIVTYLAAGNTGNTAELTRFFDLHILILPTVLILLFAAKMYMFETHGASEPPTGLKGEVKYHQWFPGVLSYLMMIGAVFLGLLLAASVLFPLALPPEYSVAAAASYTAQPDWYFISLYQLLKLGMFAGVHEPDAMALVTVGLVLAVILPFVDRNQRRNPLQRPVYSTLGLVFIVELVWLTIWGYLTPGQDIPIPQSIAGLAIPALVTIGAVWVVWRMRKPARTPSPASQPTTAKGSSGSLMRVMRTPFKVPALTGSFVILLLVGSIAFASFVNSFSAIQSEAGMFFFSLVTLVGSFAFMAFIVKRLVRINESARQA
ncbi:MAG: cytochrome bc complex cytochrome b subunit [Nitrososphaerota archaeon]|jgi:cytochrome b6|nr:cytochrome bc complex cytochrome b subunit [Nitrososphaerota archaeon]MDG6970904.1 cytochrome bc complex cytochrome b subunit [Nitrososphaerota archaeon]MDG7033652.1 cytochrome bc complex cytochrome b subunit [Nitrososphaerota archaeon]